MSEDEIRKIIVNLSGMNFGYLLNCGEVLMKDGISRILNGAVE